jgi:hypothetical protein
VFVSVKEREALAKRTKQVGMTVFNFLRSAGQQALSTSVTTIAKINREQAELAALLRKTKQSIQVLRQITAVQARLVQAAQKIRT